MNDEASSSTSAHPPPDRDGSAAPPGAAKAAKLAERRKRNRQIFNRKRGDLLDDVIRNLDILVYAELNTIYYMDCSLLRLFLRAFVQFIFLTPKPAIMPEDPQNRPIVGALFLSNAVCLLCHIWFDAPSAGESTRGFLHGGLAMDFIGQMGPSSKIHLALLDVLVLILQLVVVAITTIRKRLKEPQTILTPSTIPARSQNGQDLDSEERGVRRSEEAQGIEMQTLNPSGSTATDAAQSSDRDALLASTAPRTDTHIFDAFHSGQIVVADVDIWKSIKEHAEMMKNARQTPTPSMQSFRNDLAQRMLRMRMGTEAIRQTL